MELPIKSPCVSICALDERDVCIGCYRSGEEISRWGDMTRAEKIQVMARVAARESESCFVIKQSPSGDF